MAIRRTLPARFAGLSILLAVAGATSAEADCGLANVESAVCSSITALDPPWALVGGISGDGHTVVGGIGQLPARWVDGVLQPLGPLPPDFDSGYAKAANADGSLILGVMSLTTSSDRVAFLWTPGNGIEVLALEEDVDPFDISEDGHVIGGSRRGHWPQPSSLASRWVDGVLEDLSGPELGSGMAVTSLSADGTRAVGTGSLGDVGDGRVQALLWDATGATNLMQSWRDAGDFSSQGIAYRLTPGGTLAVGWAEPPMSANDPVFPDRRPVRWDPQADPEVVYLELGAHTNGAALDLSADGARLVGGLYSGASSAAALWNADGDLELLADRLAAQGVDLTGWSLNSSLAVSDDGRTVVGSVRQGDPDTGVDSGYVAVLSPTVGLDVRPGSSTNVIPQEAHGRVMLALYGSSSLDVAALDTGVLAFGPGGAPVHAAFPLEDLNGDGFADRRLLFQIPAVGLATGDTSACLEAPGVDGFRVCSHVTVTPGSCGDGFALALLLPPVLLIWRRRSA